MSGDAGAPPEGPPTITLPDIREARKPESVAMVVLDLDGTCLDVADQHLHPRVADAVRLAGRYVPVVIATGRMYRSALPWARRLGVRAPLICYQGALVRAMPDPDPGEGDVYGERLFEDPVDGPTAQKVIAIARQEGWHRQAYVDDRLLCEEDRPEAHMYARIAGVEIDYVHDLSAASEHGSTKLACIIDDTAEVARCRAVMTRELGGHARVTRSLPQFVEIVNPRAGKARALTRLAERLGIDLSMAVAVGDAPNDTDLLEACGYGVAVRGAPDELLRHADATCAPPSEAGVADVLETLLLHRS